MTVDWTKPIQTRDGRPARLLCEDLRGRARFAVAIMETGEEYIQEYPESGQIFPDGSMSGLDLKINDIINTPEEPEETEEDQGKIIIGGALALSEGMSREEQAQSIMRHLRLAGLSIVSRFKKPDEIELDVWVYDERPGEFLSAFGSTELGVEPDIADKPIAKTTIKVKRGEGL